MSEDESVREAQSAFVRLEAWLRENHQGSSLQSALKLLEPIGKLIRKTQGIKDREKDVDKNPLDGPYVDLESDQIGEVSDFY